MFAAIGPGAARPTRSRCASSGGGCAGARAASSRCCSTSRSSPASATSTPTRRCGRAAASAADRPRRCGRPTSAGCTRRSGRSWPRRSSGAARSIDDYTAPDGDGSMQERLDVYQRTGEPCPRCGRPVKRIVIGARSTHFCSWCQRLPAADRKGAARDPADDDRRRGAGRPALDRARRRGALGLTPARRPGPRRARTERTKRAAATRGRRPGRRCRRRAGLMSILRLAGVTREIGTFVDPRRDRRRDRARRPDRPGRAERRRQDDAAAPRGRARRARPRRGRTASAGCRSGCSPRRRISTRRSWPRRTCGTAVRTGAAHLEAMAERAGGARARRPGRPSRPTPTCSTASRCSAATRSTSGSTRR